MNTILFIGTIIYILIAIKALTIGSNFNFILWIKYKKEYVDWYNSIQKMKFVPKEKQNV